MDKASIQSKIDIKTQELKDFATSEQAEVDKMQDEVNKKVAEARAKVHRMDGAIMELQSMLKEMECPDGQCEVKKDGKANSKSA